MNYKLAFNTEPNANKIIFNCITFDTFKINIINRYKGNMKRNPSLVEVIFKIRTLNDQLLPTKEGNHRVILKDAEFKNYQILNDKLNSYHYKTKQAEQKTINEEYVHFMISLFLSNYNLN